jgi:hypothetical protein
MKKQHLESRCDGGIRLLITSITTLSKRSRSCPGSTNPVSFVPEPDELPLTTLCRRSAFRFSIVCFSSLNVGVESGLTEDMGY